MESHADVSYRLQIAGQYLDRAEEEAPRQHWRDVVDFAQSATENAAKAAIALWRPIPRSHEPVASLEEIARRADTTAQERDILLVLATCCERLGYKMHQRVTYGDEELFISPWELFGEKDALEALVVARQALEAARRLRELREAAESGGQ